eukprot:368328-Prymnesium_polylepis.1
MQQGWGRLRLDSVLRQPHSDFELFKIEHTFALAPTDPNATGTTVSIPDDQDVAGCDNSCSYSYDNDCDDGGPGSEFDSCLLGTDCADCGP